MAEMLIGGEWRRATAGAEIEVVNPATEDVVASVPSSAVADVELAVATASSTSSTPPPGTLETTSSVAGLTTSISAPAAA